MNGKPVYRQVGLLASAALVAAAALWWSSRRETPPSPSPDRSAAIRVRVQAVAADDTLLDRTVGLPDSATVQAALETATAEAGVTLGTREYDFGVLVVKIGTVAAGPEGDWTYRLNDSLPPVGVRECIVREGDRVVFHFAKNAGDTATLID